LVSNDRSSLKKPRNGVFSPSIIGIFPNYTERNK